jgi:hypothetical protein
MFTVTNWAMLLLALAVIVCFLTRSMLYIAIMRWYNRRK